MQFDPDRCAEIASTEVRLQKMALHFRKALTDRGLESMATTAKLEAVYDDLSRRIAFEFAAMTLAGTEHPVYFEETAYEHVERPANWFEHLKQDVADLLYRFDLTSNLGDRLMARVRNEVETIAITARGTKYVPINWCPHIPMRDGRGDAEVFHIRWAGGLDECRR